MCAQLTRDVFAIAKFLLEQDGDMQAERILFTTVSIVLRYDFKEFTSSSDDGDGGDTRIFTTTKYLCDIHLSTTIWLLDWRT